MQISVKSHGNIINALIRVLQVKRFNIPSDTVFAIQSVLKKRDVSFFDTWSDICATVQNFPDYELTVIRSETCGKRSPAGQKIVIAPSTKIES